ncbi:MAG TPA: glycosyltransferase family 1 protein [Opitutus sp.]|nr:glycosyltransferase family 1 protein [Opitutus sp.]
MRLLFDHQIFSLQSRGGISRYFWELASRLRRDGVDLAIRAGLHRSLVLREHPAAWVHGRYLAPWPKTGPLRRALNAALTRRHFRRHPPDLVHETYFRPGSAYAPARPTVVTVFDLIHFKFPAEVTEGEEVRSDLRAAVARADRVLCISETTRRDLLELLPSLDPARVRAIPLGGLELQPHTAPPAPPPGLDAPFLLHVGLRAGYKNFDLVLRCLAESPRLRAQFHLVAFGGPPFTRDELARIQSLGLDAGRIRHRAGDDAALAACYAHAAALVCPSRYEGFGLTPLEAMAHGRPVLCSIAGSFPEVVGDAAVTFDPAQPADLARAIQSLVDSPGLAAELRARGPRQAARFSWDRCAAETLAVYRELTG